MIQRKFISCEEKYCDKQVQPVVLIRHYIEIISFLYILQTEYIWNTAACIALPVAMMLTIQH